MWMNKKDAGECIIWQNERLVLLTHIDPSFSLSEVCPLQTKSSYTSTCIIDGPGHLSTFQHFLQYWEEQEWPALVNISGDWAGMRAAEAEDWCSFQWAQTAAWGSPHQTRPQLDQPATIKIDNSTWTSNRLHATFKMHIFIYTIQNSGRWYNLIDRERQFRQCLPRILIRLEGDISYSNIQCRIAIFNMLLLNKAHPLEKLRSRRNQLM